MVRVLGPDGEFAQDVICLVGEQPRQGDTVYDPTNPARYTHVPAGEMFDVRAVVMDHGCRIVAKESLHDMAERCRKEVARLPSGCLRLINPHIYKVSVSEHLKTLRGDLIDQLRQGMV